MRLRVCVGALVALLLATPGARALDAVIFQSDWLPSGDKAPAYVGLHEGFYEAEGLAVTILSGRGATEALTKLATGAADVGTGGIGSLMSAAVENPLPVRAVYAVYTKPPESLFTTADSGITNLKNLVGRTVAAAGLSSSRVVWPLVLARNGVTEAQMTMRLVDANAVIPMLASGQADAVSSYLTTAPGADKILRGVGKTLRVLPWSDFGLEGYGTTLFASERMIASRPEVLARFVRAYRKSVAFTIANPDAAARAVKASAPAIDLDVTAAQIRAAIPLMKNDISDRDGLGVFNPALLRTTWDWVAKSQNYPADKIDPESLVAHAILPAP